MPLVQLRDIQLAYGPTALLDHVDLSIEAGERLCLVGRNGSGKSTLMQLIAGEIEADDGQLELSDGVRIARLQQDVPGSEQGSVFEVVAGGLPQAGELLQRHEALTRELAEGNAAVLAEMETVQTQLEACGGWELSQRVDTVLSKLSLGGEHAFAQLSGGMKRRVLLARALVQEPDLLLLDEPTNHLDIDAIRWLEEFLKQYNATLLFITHDRALIRSLATRIIELDRGRLTSWPGNYDRYLEKKAEALAAEEKANAEFDRKLSREEKWIRQGIKARRTRNEGRVRALKAMREEYASRRSRQGQARASIQQGERSGKKVIEAEDIGFQVDDRWLFRHFSLTLLRGDRIGIIGANGCGKSTLLRVLLGRERPDEGHVEHGTKLEVAYFDQLRDSLALDKTVVENVAEGSDVLEINGQQKHVMGYLQDFLFEPGRARQPVSALSGGERNRLLLAKLFTRRFNLLVMDEPTNDLDVETLELLEEQLMQYQGTLLLVSHDREFLDNVVTSTIAFEASGPQQYVGGYEDWLRQRQHAKPAASHTAAPKAQKKPKAVSPAVKKLTYGEELELQTLPEKLEALEARIEALQHEMADPDFYQQPGEAVAERTRQLEVLQSELDETFTRWEELDSRSQDSGSP
jgi:ATP-binding cassette subfamily F protein uup